MASSSKVWVAACACLLVAVVVMAQPADKMTKYYKRTGQKFLDEKAKVIQRYSLCAPAVAIARILPLFPFAVSSQCSCCSQEEGVHKLPSGMLYRVMKTGKTSGKKSSPNVGDSCEVKNFLSFVAIYEAMQAQSCAELVEATATAKGRARTALRTDNAKL